MLRRLRDSYQVIIKSALTTSFLNQLAHRTPCMRLTQFTVLLLLLLLNGCSSPSSSSTGSVAGYLFDETTHERVSGATIWIEGVASSIVTDSEGEFTFSKVKAGSSVIRFRKDNFGVGKTGLIHVSANESNYLPISFKSIYGSWHKKFEFDNGYSSFRPLNLKSNGTFSAGGNKQGTWSLTGDRIQMDYSYGAHYWGTVAESMIGSLSEEIYSGTWTATR